MAGTGYGELDFTAPGKELRGNAVYVADDAVALYAGLVKGGYPNRGEYMTFPVSDATAERLLLVNMMCWQLWKVLALRRLLQLSKVQFGLQVYIRTSSRRSYC
ncbi:hypothetical protein CIB48_g2169 [Xylaria polymorpha]|nr:hypothetical protein CIB48_g2169 [Xylaria polymorpha]